MKTRKTEFGHVKLTTKETAQRGNMRFTIAIVDTLAYAMHLVKIHYNPNGYES